MKKTTCPNFYGNKIILFLFLMVTFMGNAQVMKVKVKGGAVVVHGSTITITSGTKIKFEITNTETGNCKTVNVKSIELSDTVNFSISPSDRSENIKPKDCHGEEELEFDVTAKSIVCGTTTARVTIKSNFADFWFDVTVIKAPIISVLGGSPLADVIDGATATTATNGTYFGVVEQGVTQTRRFYIANTGSCPLTISSITSAIGDFTIATPVALPFDIASGSSFYFEVTFLAPTIAGTYLSTISVLNNAASPTNLYTFNVRAEVFDFDIPGPGGVIADFRLWLKATRGTNKDHTNSGEKISLWKDLGTNPKNAKQDDLNLQPTYLNDAVSNINFNPIIKFENVAGTEQYLYNEINGFYSQDIFIVMMPNTPVPPSTAITPFSSASLRNTIFAGVSKKTIDDNTFDIADITGIGFGNYTTRFTNEVLTYAQNTEASFNGAAETGTTYANAGIINARNKTNPDDGMELLYNSKALLAQSTINDILPYKNVGYIDGSLYQGTPYWIGRNYGIQGSLNGRVAEIMTFAQRVPDTERPKIETYLAIKYGITLGATTAEKNYVNSLGTTIWDFTANSGFNHNIAGIGRDDASDLNQKQSKSINNVNEVAIYLGNVFTTNSANSNEFSATLNFLVWGCNNGTYTANGTNTVTIGSSLSSTITKIDRKWKIVETGGDVGNTFVSVPITAFDNSLNDVYPDIDEEYVLIVSETQNFADGDIIDVIPLKEVGTNRQTWYDFDGTKFFTFGKTPKLTQKRSVSIAAGDYLVGEYALNLNINAFTISAWVRGVTSSVNPRTIMAKGSKLQLRLSPVNKVEVMMDDDLTPRFTSVMALNDGKWHNVTFVYDSGTIYLYVDGILDKSEQNVNPPSPNYNRFSVGAVYVDKSTVSNPFLGEIDEVYVWDQGLTQDQARYLMNQEIEKVTGNLVNGKSIPKAITKNEVFNIPVPIPWSTLRAYYDFNTFYGTTVEGLTDLRNFLRIKYLNKSKTIVGAQTAPLPYVSSAAGVWGDAATWVNSAVQNPPNSLGLDGLTTIDWNIAETSHSITSGDRDITVLSLKNNSGKITIDGTMDIATGTGTGHGLRVTHYLELDGSIDLFGESQLVQDEGSVLDIDSGGDLERDQQGTANSFNYNYWTSPVGPISGDTGLRGIGTSSTNSSYTISGVLWEGTNSLSPGAVSFDTSYTWADNYVGSNRISSYWLYKFYGADDDYNSWFPRINETSNLLPGEGYTMKGTSGAAPITNNQNYVFKGKPYNGDVVLELSKNHITPLGDVDRLIGNPYPSAIDANEFIMDNINETINEEVGRNTVNVFNGALYFWHHFGQVNSHYLAEYVGGYATYTLMGGVEAYATDSRINNSNPLVGGGKIPEKYIPVGQGFFVSTKLPSSISGTTTTVVEGGNILFKNSQRVFVKEGVAGIDDGSLFFKGSKKTNDKTSAKNKDARAKIRLQFYSPTGYHRKLLVGVDKNTSNHFDLGYDAPIADINKDDMFWIFDGAKFVIQGVNNFNSDQELPLGIKIAKAGLAQIKIDKLENMDEDVSLHIKDKLTGETHNISMKTFEINLTAGEYLDRFVLTFKINKLMAEDVTTEVLIPEEAQPMNDGIQVFMDNTVGELQIRNNGSDEISGVAIYNYLGQSVKSWNSNLNRRLVSLPISIATGVYIVNITTKNGKTVKKISVE